MTPEPKKPWELPDTLPTPKALTTAMVVHVALDGIEANDLLDDEALGWARAQLDCLGHPDAAARLGDAAAKVADAVSDLAKAIKYARDLVPEV